MAFTSRGICIFFQMARREQQSEQGCPRTRSKLSKSGDDNVPGISWKEEQELRKAMYVSLRDQQQSNPEGNTCERLRSLRSSLSSTTRITSPKKLRSNLLKSRSAVDNKLARKETCNPNRKRTSQGSQSSSKSSKREQLNSNTMNSTANIGTVGTSQQTEPKKHSRSSTKMNASFQPPRFTCSAYDFLLKNGFRL
ncbi:unnamed protein product [Trichobilharzia szidati]|nr:unnamed protein product [Trichobilharzia szidati]